MTSFILKFGKFKGQDFQSTPKWYQDWLVKQDWFKLPAPTPTNNFEEGQRRLSQLSKSLKGWNGSSARGSAIYNQMFEAEMMIEDALFCNCGKMKSVDEKDCGMGCGF